MQFDLEKATRFSVGRQEVIALLQDTEKFMIAGGSTDEKSIYYDDDTGLWHGTAKDSIPVLPKPKYTFKVEKSEKGSKSTVEAGMGIQTIHTWTVEPISDEECIATEHVTCHAPLYVYYAVKWQLPSSQAKTHKGLQDFLS